MNTSLTIDQATERLESYLKERRMRMTRERLAVVEAVWSLKRVFKASDVVGKLGQGDFMVGRSTVYDTLSLLDRCGLVETLPLGSEETLYARRSKGYLLLICSSCGKVRQERDTALFEHIEGRKFEAFTPVRSATIVWGNCSVCSRKARKQKSSSSRKKQ